MNLQYQLSNGRWMSCDSRSPEFLQRCIKYNETISELDICKSLRNGAVLKYGSDWDDCIRCKDFALAESKMLEEKMANYVPKYESVEEFDARDDER